MATTEKRRPKPQARKRKHNAPRARQPRVFPCGHKYRQAIKLPDGRFLCPCPRTWSLDVRYVEDGEVNA